MVCPHDFRTAYQGAPVPREDPIELVVFDMDGVLIDVGSSWRMVHDHFGTDNTDALHAYMAGRIDDHEFIRHDVRLWTQRGPVHHDLIDEILRIPPLMAGAHATVERLHDAGKTTAIVSGGLEPMARKVGDALGIDKVWANGLHVDADGHLTGEGILRTPLHDKAAPLRGLLEDLGVPAGRTAAVGNSCPDVSMFEHVGLGIAFNPDDACVTHGADVTVDGRDLQGILPHLL